MTVSVLIAMRFHDFDEYLKKEVELTNLCYTTFDCTEFRKPPFNSGQLVRGFETGAFQIRTFNNARRSERCFSAGKAQSSN
jgi:hypothetical protein